MAHTHFAPSTHGSSPSRSLAQGLAHARRLTVFLLVFVALAAIAPTLTPVAGATLGKAAAQQGTTRVYLPIVIQQRPGTPAPAATGTVFTSSALLEEAESRATRFPINTLAQRQLLVKANQIMAAAGKEGNGLFAWESGPLYLAYAYHITGKHAFADLAVKVLKEHTFAEEPRLQNREDYALATSNEVLVRSQRTTARSQTYALLSGYTSSAWKSGDKDRMLTWLRTFATDMRDSYKPGSCITNVKWFHLEAIAAVGAATGDRTLLDFAFKAYRRNLDSATCGGVRVIGSQGFFEHEMRRFAKAGDDTWYYAGYSMVGMVRLAEIARNQGVNLYDYTTPDGRNLRQTLDAHVPYLLGEKSWPHKGGNVSFPIAYREYMEAYEIGYIHWPDANYLKVLQKYGDNRRANEVTNNLGPAAYLFANSTVASRLPSANLPALETDMITEPAVAPEDAMTEPAVAPEDAMTEPAVVPEDAMTEPAVTLEGAVTEPAVTP